MSIAVKDVHGLTDANTHLTEFRANSDQAVKSFVDADGNYNGGVVAPPGGQGGPSDTVVTEQTFGQASAAGVAATRSRGDHTHGTMTDPVPVHSALATGIHGVGASTVESVAGSQAKVDAHKDLTTGVHGVGAGAVVGTTLAQVLTNKDLRGNLILTIGLDAAKGAAGYAGRIYYATDTKILYYDTGPPDANWIECLRGETVSRLASLAEKAHASLTGITTDQHHAQIHGAGAHSGAIGNADQIGAGTVNNTEFGYLDGVTSALQTQLNGKSPTITGAASTVVTENLASSCVVVSDAGGKITCVIAVSDTEVGYLNGVTSAIQDQLNARSRGLASRTTPNTIASSEEVVVLNTTIPSNSMVAGTCFRITASGVATVTTLCPTMAWRLRIGPTTLTGNILASVIIAPTESNNKPWTVDLLVTLRTAGAAGTIIGNGFLWNELSTTLPEYIRGTATTAAVAVDTTVDNLLELTFQFSDFEAGINLVAHNVLIEKVK